MAIALTLKQKEYVLETDRELPAEEQTKFFIKPLSARQNAQIQDGMRFNKTENGATIENIGTHTLEILKYGLVGWENFNDADGNPIKFTKNMDENIDKLCVEYRYELSGAIMELSNLGPAKEKN